MRLYLLRYGEIGTKSPSIRRDFENILIQNIERAFMNEGAEVFIEREWGRIFATVDEDFSHIFSRIFGLVSYSPVIESSSEPDDITAEVLNHAEGKEGTFAIRCRRTGTHDYSSQSLAKKIGENVLEKNDGLAVDLDDPDHEFHVEVRSNRSFIFEEVCDSPGGLPLSSQGKAVGYLKDEEDFLALWLMMKRGVRTHIFHHPDTSQLDRFRRWDHNPHIVGEGGSTDLETLDLPEYIDAVILGETKDEIPPLDIDIPVFRPLVGFTDEMIEGRLLHIKKLENGGGC